MISLLRHPNNWCQIKRTLLNLKGERFIYANELKYISRCYLKDRFFQNVRISHSMISCFNTSINIYSDMQYGISKHQIKHFPILISQAKQPELPPPKFILKNTENTNTMQSLDSSNQDDKNKLTKPNLWQRVKKEIIHYYHGFRLLGLELKIALGIVIRVMRGIKLTRRERKQEAKIQRLKAKLELTKFLQETLVHATGPVDANSGTQTVVEFREFLKQLQDSGKHIEVQDITRFSKLFEDQLTLESLENKQLRMLCQILSLPTIGPTDLLRFQISMRVRQLKAEDRLLAKEGVNQIPPWELQSLCQERGMPSFGISQDRLRAQIGQWLVLHLEKNVPILLLLFSRAVYPSTSDPHESSLKQAIAQLPSSVSEEAAARVLETIPLSQLDPKLKIEVLRKEQDNIKAARVKRDKELAEQAKSTVPSLETLDDVAPVLQGLRNEELDQSSSTKAVSESSVLVKPVEEPIDVSIKASKVKVAAPKEDTEISVGDLAEIESAIANTSSAIHDEAVHDLKEKVAETVKVSQKQAALVTSEVKLDKRTTKVASRLQSRVDNLINEMNNIVDKLGDKRQQLLKDIEIREVHMKHSTEPLEKSEIYDAIKADHNEVVDINDLLMALKRIQKVSDDTKWQKILQVLDEDHDGKIELKHVLSVIELLGSENVKLSSTEVTRVLEMLDNEELANVLQVKEDDERSVNLTKQKNDSDKHVSR